MTDKCRACDLSPREPASPYCARCEASFIADADAYEQFLEARENDVPAVNQR
jgi:hypothetical protein